MDRLDAMAVLVAVVTAGSLSGASRRLRMPLPTVSRKLQDLESHVQAKLLVRSTRRLALTDAGQSYVAACRRILEQVDEAERQAAGDYAAPRGELLITAPLVFGRLHVLPVVAGFLEAIPAVDVRLRLTDRPLDLIGDHLDLAVRIGNLPDSRLMARRVGDIRTVICASPAYLAARGTPTSPAHLASHDCVTFENGIGSADWAFRGTASVRVHSRLTVNTAEAALDAALLNLGLTRVLSYQSDAAVGAGTLVRVLERFERPAVPVNLVYLSETPLRAKLRAFLDFAAPRLETRLTPRPAK